MRHTFTLATLALLSACFTPVGSGGGSSSGEAGSSSGGVAGSGTSGISGSGSNAGSTGGVSGGASSGGSSGGSTGSTGVSCTPGAVDACTTVQPPTGEEVYCNYGLTTCPGEAADIGVATPGVCALYASAGTSSCQSSADCSPYEACADGSCVGFGCPAQPIDCPAGCTFEAVPHTCGGCACATCPSSTNGGSSGGGSTGGTGTGGSDGGFGGDGGCTADDQCAANLPPGYGIYCEYGSTYCSSDTVTETAGSCVVYSTDATSCTTDLDCSPDDFCSLPPGCVGGSGCEGSCMPIECPVGDDCPSDCPALAYPHSCPACTCATCADEGDGGFPGPDGGLFDGGCTSDVQCAAPFASYCDFTVEPCGQPLGQYLQLPGSCAVNADQPTCTSNADCAESESCALPNCTDPTNCTGTCQPIGCSQPPACFEGCTLTSVPHQCPVCVCPASSCCLACE